MNVAENRSERSHERGRRHPALSIAAGRPPDAPSRWIVSRLAMRRPPASGRRKAGTNGSSGSRRMKRSCQTRLSEVVNTRRTMSVRACSTSVLSRRTSDRRRSSSAIASVIPTRDASSRSTARWMRCRSRSACPSACSAATAALRWLAFASSVPMRAATVSVNASTAVSSGVASKPSISSDSATRVTASRSSVRTRSCSPTSARSLRPSISARIRAAPSLRPGSRSARRRARSWLSAVEVCCGGVLYRRPCHNLSRPMTGPSAASTGRRGLH